MNSLHVKFHALIFRTVSIAVFVVGGGSALSQPGDTTDPPSAVQEETSTSDDQGEVIERGIIRDHRGQQKLLPLRRPASPVPETSSPIIRDHRIQPESSSPSQIPTLQITPKVLSPSIVGPTTGTLAPPDRYTAPTANLTMVANALQLRHKSLTTLVTASPNLPLTQPVEISIGYYSPAGTQRITQSYVRSTGNRFLYNHREGDGKPRPIRMDITLSEPKPSGSVTTFALQWQADLDPLYDVSIGPFAFDLISKCDAVGKSEILFTWYSPDREYHKRKFSMRPGSRTTIGQFAWSRSEISWSHKFFREHAEHYDEDNLATEMLWACLPAGCGFSVSVLTQDHLLTGTSTLVKGNLKA